LVFAGQGRTIPMLDTILLDWLPRH
jgi:hypothetical protein